MVPNERHQHREEEKLGEVWVEKAWAHGTRCCASAYSTCRRPTSCGKAGSVSGTPISGERPGMGPRRRCVNSGIARRDGADERWNWVIPVAGRPKVRSPVAGRGGEDGMSPVARRPIMVPLFSCKAGLQGWRAGNPEGSCVAKPTSNFKKPTRRLIDCMLLKGSRPFLNTPNHRAHADPSTHQARTVTSAVARVDFLLARRLLARFFIFFIATSVLRALVCSPVLKLAARWRKRAQWRIFQSWS